MPVEEMLPGWAHSPELMTCHHQFLIFHLGENAHLQRTDFLSAGHI